MASTIKSGSNNDLYIQTDGIDRIVPIGSALDISLNWDGFDLNKSLTRVIEIK